MSDDLSLLEAIMVEEDDLELFPQPVLDAWLQPSQREHARKLLRQAMAKEAKGARKAKQQLYVDDLRLWMRPIAKAPGLFTFNGFGTRLYGSFQPRSDGTAIGTQWITALYLPVLPLGAYLFESHSDGSSYNFFGQTPLPPRSWIAPSVWGALAVGLVGFGVVSGVESRRWVDVHVYNGLGQPVLVEAAEASVLVGPRSHRLLTVSVEADVLEARDVDGGVVDAVAVDLSGTGNREAVFNVAGRAVVGSGWVTYGTASERPYTVLTERFVVLDDDVSYPFTEPPEEISTSASGTARSLLEALDDPADPGSAMAGLLGQDAPDAAWRLGVAAFSESPGHSFDYQVFYATLLSSDDVRQRCDETTEALWQDVQVHRLCQDIGRTEGWDGLLAHYEGLAADHPASASHRYLLGRLEEDPAKAMAHFTTAQDLDPTNPWPVMAEGYHHQVISGNQEKALDAYGRLRELDADLFAERAGEWVRVQRVLGRPVDLAVLDSADASVFSTADMLRLEADPGLLVDEVARIRSLLQEEAPEDRANVVANAALVAGDLGRLHVANKSGAGLDLWEALSDGGDLEAIRTLPEGPTAPRVAVLRWTGTALLGEADDALLDDVAHTAPAVVELLKGRRFEAAAIQGALTDVAPQLHGPVWFAAYRLTGERAFAAKAKAWSLPQELPLLDL